LLLSPYQRSLLANVLGLSDVAVSKFIENVGSHRDETSSGSSQGLMMMMMIMMIIMMIIIIILIYLTANGLSPGGSGYYART
jgi:uncharacterized membrane protein